MYYLNCIVSPGSTIEGSWGLSLFVLFERPYYNLIGAKSSWGLSLFVLFELLHLFHLGFDRSWGLSLFVLFEPISVIGTYHRVLED